MLFLLAVTGHSSASPATTGLISVILGVLGIAGLAGAAYVYFRSTVTRTAVENYKEAYESLQARMATMEGEIDVAKDHAKRCDAELAAQKTAYEMLADQVRGTQVITALGEKLEARLDTLIGSQQAMARDLTEGQDHMAEALGGLVFDLRKRLDLDSTDRRHQDPS